MSGLLLVSRVSLSQVYWPTHVVGGGASEGVARLRRRPFRQGCGEGWSRPFLIFDESRVPKGNPGKARFRPTAR
jgi:hypothetical protein